MQNVNRDRTNVILGQKTKLLFGKDHIKDTLNGLEFEISAQSFYQVNPVQTEKLYQTAIRFANLTGEETAIDAYCGIGTISLSLAEKCRAVYGVEIVETAIEDAKHNAELNELDNLRFEVGNAEEWMAKSKEKGIRPNVIMVDPPRKGLTESLIESATGMNPNRIFYVSCNPATLVRDIQSFMEKGYHVEGRIQPVDQFPQTAHVETCVLLVRENINDDELVSIKVDLEGISLNQGEYKPTEKPTYGNIKKWIKEKYGFNVSTLYIAQIKDKVGLEKRKNYNKGSGEEKVPTCPAEKEEAIMDAFKHFNLI